MASKRNSRNWDAPQRHPDHRRPITRRDFVSQGFLSGSALALSGGVLSLFSNPRDAYAALSSDLTPLLTSPCNIATEGAGKIPFICFDLAGGANIAGSNVLVGREGGQMDFLGTAGYEKLGLPGDMVPGLNDPTTGLPYANTDFGLAFHSDSAFKRGMERSMAPGRGANLNGAIIPSRSDNDTANNPHNPLYGIARAGADGSILTLAGSENTDSGGNSMVPAMMMDPELRPTKVDRPSDVTGLVDTGQLVGILGPDDATAVMESIYRISSNKMNAVDTGQTVSADAVVKDMVRCGYLKAADIADRFGATPLDPADDPAIVGPNGIFSEAEFNANNRDGQEFRKTASVMKLVMNGFAGAACIEMGGYDYHGGARAEGEVKDERAGRCMGACIEYAARIGVPLMMYVFSDGSLSSNGAIDNSAEGRGKGEWVSDNSSTAAAFFMVYNPNGRPALRGGTPEEQARHQQIGYMDASASVQRAATPAANNVNLLVNTVVLNYMALHGEEGLFANVIPNHGLGDSSLRDSMTAFDAIVSGTIGPLNPA
ncbi:general secretion pathway protein GspF [Woeseia oceani]|uniref:General secretion pathway protein GspF n=1 Tax=Woeseia oceani TaxID=1548547 RepID=A0A193LIN6_9GAMM|nr:general secretion pathway protein GspF [Woeseia oceani]ANO52259.1 general secretion pathway protein GspF [Woeseia oceani]